MIENISSIQFKEAIKSVIIYQLTVVTDAYELIW